MTQETVDPSTVWPPGYVQGLEEQVRKLQAEVDELEQDNEQYRDEAAQADAERNDADSLAAALHDPANRVIEAGWHTAEVVSVKPQRFGVSVILDVDMTVGQALIGLRPGQRLTLSGAHSQDFDALYQEV